MKLASLKGGRDGRLVVVSRDLTRAADAQSSSAACKVGAIAEASAQRDRSRDTTTSRPSRPPLSEPSFIYFGSLRFGSKCFFRPAQQSA